MAYTDINSEDRLVQKTFGDYLHNTLGWDSLYAWNDETFGPTGTLGRASEREVVLVRDLRDAIVRLNPGLPEPAVAEAIEKLTRYDFSRSALLHNKEFYGYIRDGVPVVFRDDKGEVQHARAKVIDFRNPANNRFLAVRELKIQGLCVPHYNRRADLVCFVNGLPLVFIELKAVYRNIRAGYDGNLSDYRDTIPHAFYHNAFLVVSNGDRARYGSITAGWDHFSEWKRQDEKDKGQLEARVLLDGMLAKDRLLDLVENPEVGEVLGKLKNALAGVADELDIAGGPGKKLEARGRDGSVARQPAYDKAACRRLQPATRWRQDRNRRHVRRTVIGDHDARAVHRQVAGGRAFRAGRQPRALH